MKMEVKFFKLAIGFACIAKVALTNINPPAEQYRKSPGSEISLRWTYLMDPSHEFLNFQCGWKDDSKPATGDSDLIVLARKQQNNGPLEVEPTVNLASKFAGRLTTEDDSLIIKNLQRNDSGRYFCVLTVYDRNAFRTQSYRSTYTTLQVLGSPESEEQSSDSSVNRGLLIALIVLAIVVLIIFGIVVALCLRHRKNSQGYQSTRSQEEWKGVGYSVKNEKRKNSPPASREPSGIHYSKVEIVPNLEEVTSTTSSTLPPRSPPKKPPPTPPPHGNHSPTKSDQFFIVDEKETDRSNKDKSDPDDLHAFV